MDPLTQAVVGAALPMAATRTGHGAPAGTGAHAAGLRPIRLRPIGLRTAGALGFLAGMAADLDVLIRSAADPLLFLEYHRQFTHALVFVPVGGLLCALALHLLAGRRRRPPFRPSLLACTLGYATHGLLDACTSYGTMLFWPFSEARIALSIVPVVDPLFTLPATALLLLAWWRRRPLPARLALAWAGLYLALGAWQQQTALAGATALAAARGHAPARIEAKPTFANILLWKTIYETGDGAADGAGTRFHVDGVRPGLGPLLRARVYPGTSIPRLDLARDFPWLDPGSRQARDVERFRRLSGGFLATDADRQGGGHPGRIVDVRYSFLPTSVRGLWSIELAPDAGPDAPVRYRTHREGARERLGALWGMIVGDGG